MLSQIQHGGSEDVNRNPILLSVGAIFIMWLTFGFSVWYAFYATLLAGIAGGLALFTGMLRLLTSEQFLMHSFVVEILTWQQGT